jgi:hypothetical protein
MTSAGEITEHSRTGVAGDTQTVNHVTGESCTNHVTGSMTNVATDDDTRTAVTTYGQSGEFGGMTTQTNTQTGAWSTEAKTGAGDVLAYSSDRPHAQSVTLASGATYTADNQTATLTGAASDSNRLNINCGAAGSVGLEYIPTAGGCSQSTDYTGVNFFEK